MEAELEQNLESFFNQDYPDYEIIFGARDAENPALQIAERVRARFPQVKSSVVLSGPPTWPNAKVFSLQKMIAASTRAYFIISDSDVRVAPDFLRNTIPPLLNKKVGLITCMYRGIPASDFWSSLEALGLSVEMSSGVMVADMLEGMRFALGPAMATRRDALDAIGGIAATADYYSDDFELGNRIWAKGYKVVLSHHIVNNVLTPRSLWRTLGDQLRWMKSTRYSHAFRPSRTSRRNGTRPLRSRLHPLRSRVRQSSAASDSGGLGSRTRSASLDSVLALSLARRPGFLDMAGQLHEPSLLLARRNLPLRKRRPNHARAPFNRKRNRRDAVKFTVGRKKIFAFTIRSGSASRL
jgi:hypothetical protein